MRFWIGLFLMAGWHMAGADTGGVRTLFTFADSEHGAWTAVNDNVMGGRSEGRPELSAGVLRFSGELSLENNGGFSSIRHPVSLDLSDYDGVRLRVRGDGRRYQLRLHSDARYYGRPVAFGGTFATEPGEWVDVDVRFDELQATFRGRQLDGYSFDPAKVELLGILLADKQPGPFALEIDRIVAYRN